MPSFDTDDFWTYNTVPYVEHYEGCGGEFCPGPYDASNPRLPDDPPECAQCAARTQNVAHGYRPIS